MRMQISKSWLAATHQNAYYWSEVSRIAKELGSDGCSWATELFRSACLEHDIHYRTHKMLAGDKIDKATADYIFRKRMQQRSIFGVLSPMSWWRWSAVKVFGHKPWSELCKS